MSTPKFITFTGLDNLTDLKGVFSLSRAYPGKVEWGVLYGGTSNRFPGWDVLMKLSLDYPEIPRALHLCGPASQLLMGGFYDRSLAQLCFIRGFGRWQINAAAYPEPTRVRDRLQRYTEAPGIIQVRGEEFPPPVRGLQYLYDESGGRGRVAPSWPGPSSLDGRCGYAGGLRPDNVQEVLARCPAPDDSFWIDMESGVRTGEDFDLAKCRRVLELVYGR